MRHAVIWIVGDLVICLLLDDLCVAALESALDLNLDGYSEGE